MPFPLLTWGVQQSRFLQLANEFGPAFRHTIIAMDNRFGAGERLLPHVNWQALPMTVKKGTAGQQGSLRRNLNS